MNLWGVVDVLKQRNLLREKWDLIKEGEFVPLHPRELSRLYHSQEREVRAKNVISKPSDSVALSVFSSSGPWLIMRILMFASPSAAKILPEIPGR